MVTLLRLAACSVPASQFSMVAPRLRTALRFACAVFRGCALRFAPCARHFSPSGLRCSQAHSRLSLLHWAHRRLLHPQFAMVVLLRLAACSTPLLIGLTTACFAHCARRSSVPLGARFVCSPLQPFGPPMCAKRTSGPPTSQFSMVAPHRSQAHLRRSLLHWAHRRLLQPQFAMVVLLRPTACSTPLLIGLTTACFAHCARPSCAPPVSAKILRIFGRGNCKEAIFALENGIFRHGVLRAPAPLNSAWSSAALTGSLAALPASLGLLRAVSFHNSQ